VFDFSSIASTHGVVGLIDPADNLWQFLDQHPGFPDSDSAAGYYFSDGATSARQLSETIERHRQPHPDAPLRLLEFASGHGMVSRHLRSALPHADITSSDIHPRALEFIRTEIGLPTVESAHTPAEAELGGPYDVVFALSFFSHMPDSTFGPWLARLYQEVRSGGLLIFTTHGQRSTEVLGSGYEPDAQGYAFQSNSEQSDLDPAEYGMTVSLPAYVLRRLRQFVPGELLELRQGYWWQHQDLYVVGKPAESSTDA
jgi:2-polyprenyl-3-methyl-5-hydroxy-6-metoxy-1,4-benzoquinol methylase